MSTGLPLLPGDFIDELRIRNYQSLRSVDLKLGWITVIVGHSDAGKSAVIRALQAIAYNQRGTAFLTRVKDTEDTAKIAGMCAVLISTHNKEGLMWKRDEKAASYELVIPPGKQVFTKLGRIGVPPQVEAWLGIKDVVVEEGRQERVHFNFQHDPPFIIGDRGGVQAARVLGRLTGLHIFSNASKKLNSKRFETTAEIERVTALQTTAQSELAKYAEIPTQEAWLDAQNQGLIAIKEREQWLTPLRTHLANLCAYRQTVRMYAGVEQELTALSGSMAIINALEPQIQRLSSLRVLESKRTGALSQLDTALKVLEDWECPSEEQLQGVSELITRKATLGKLEHQARTALASFKMAQTLVDDAEQYLGAAQMDLTAFTQEHPNCGTCGRPL